MALMKRLGGSKELIPEIPFKSLSLVGRRIYSHFPREIIMIYGFYHAEWFWWKLR